MHIVWDQVPRWRKEANDGEGKKISERSKRNKGLWVLFPPQSPDNELPLAPLLETFRFEVENDHED